MIRKHEIPEQNLTCLHGYDSFENSYLVDDYPYGFRLRCQTRYWIETTKKGQRFCHCTSNPKKAGLVWNKVKKSIYSDLACLVLANSNGYISYTCKTYRWEPQNFEAYAISKGFDLSDPFVAGQIRTAKIIAKANSVLTVTINSTAGLTAEQADEIKKKSEENKRKALAYAIHSVDSVIDHLENTNADQMSVTKDVRVACSNSLTKT